MIVRVTMSRRRSYLVSKYCATSCLTVALITLLCCLSFSCNSSRGNTRFESANSNTSALKSNRVEVLFFHNHERCSACKSIERLVTEVMSDTFEKELSNGDIVFKIMDIDDKANQAIVDGYEVVWTSLYLNKWENGVEVRDNLTTFAFTYAENSPDVFKKGLIDQVNEMMNFE